MLDDKFRALRKYSRKAAIYALLLLAIRGITTVNENVEKYRN